MYFLEVMVWESCIIAGMVPVNTHYEDVFDRSTIAVQILDKDGRRCLKSTNAPEVPGELFDRLKTQTPVRTPEGHELHLHEIRGGYAVWRRDVSETIAVIAELRKSAEKLEHEGELLRQELKIRSDEAAVKEQNRIYSQLTDEIGGQLLLLRTMLDKHECVADMSGLFRKICLVGTYIKRRCTLRLALQSDENLPNKDLELCYHELAGCLQQMGVETDVFLVDTGTIAPEFAVFALDLFESLLEHEKFELHSINVTFETRNAFSMLVQPRNRPPGPISVDILRRTNKNGYDIQCRASEKGYQVSVFGRGG
jgi:hypothetical protein